MELGETVNNVISLAIVFVRAIKHVNSSQVSSFSVHLAIVLYLFVYVFVAVVMCNRGQFKRRLI